MFLLQKTFAVYLIICETFYNRFLSGLTETARATNNKQTNNDNKNFSLN